VIFASIQIAVKKANPEYIIKLYVKPSKE